MSRPSEGRELVMNTPPPVARAFAPDLARGFMLLLIAMANVSWFLYGRDFGMAGAHPLDGTALDRVLQAFMMIAVDGRAYPLFAFLFGYGMVQFTRSRIARGIEYREVRRMLRRRHWAMLLAFGLPHAALLFMGDIVGAYGLVGLVLVGIFFDRTDRTLTICVWVLAGLMALFAVFSLVGGIAAAVFMPTGALESADVSRDLTVATESYLASIGGRLMMWASIGVVQGFFSAVPLCILLGWLAARHGVLDDPARHRRLLTRIAVVGIPVGLLGGMPTALTHLGVFGLPSWTFSGIVVRARGSRSARLCRTVRADRGPLAECAARCRAVDRCGRQAVADVLPAAVTGVRAAVLGVGVRTRRLARHCRRARHCSARLDRLGAAGSAARVARRSRPG